MHVLAFRRNLLFLVISFLSLFFLHLHARPFVLVLSPEDFTDDVGPLPLSTEWDDLDESDPKAEEELDSGSWRPIFEPESTDVAPYYSVLSKILQAARYGSSGLMEEAVAEVEAMSAKGDPHALSAMGLVYGMGLMRKSSKAKSFLYHHFAAEAGNTQSKMALAYMYSRQDMYDKAVELYSILARVAVRSFLITKSSPVIEPIRIHSGPEENKEALRKSRGEEDEEFQITEYQAQRGNPGAMYRIGLFYYFGLRGLRLDRSKALFWFSKAVEKGEPKSMELLGEMYARGAGVERNYTTAFQYLTRASEQGLYSAYNGLGYLYVKGYGVDKNFTKAKELFEKAADHDDANGHYNLGLLYLKELGVKRDIRLACNYLILASNAGQPKALYELARMFHAGVGLKKNLAMATALYKLVSERGPWSSLSRWGMESYLRGNIGQALILYSRMAELGYEVAQSNAAWILDKYGENSMCIGESGVCTYSERHHFAHSLWWQASEQGNEHAALLIGDAYYYGRGTERDYGRAAEAYMHAKSQYNAQALFNLGYMHEHGEGLPYDLHLAKRYYDQALEIDPAAKLPVTLALASLWIRKNYADTLLVNLIDWLPEVYPRAEEWVESVAKDEGNVTILTLFVCLLTVLYLRDRQRRHGAALAVAQVEPHGNDE